MPSRRGARWHGRSRPGAWATWRPSSAAQSLGDAAIDALVAERTEAKKARNFARADAIRNELAAKGVVIEDSKDGVRWKRK